MHQLSETLSLWFGCSHHLSQVRPPSDHQLRLSLPLRITTGNTVMFACFAWLASSSPTTAASTNTLPGPDLWTLAQTSRGVHRFSTLFTAQNVRDDLGSEAGLSRAIAWCKATAVTKVYLEAFRDGYTVERATLVKSREAFAAASIDPAGCVTTTHVGKDSTGWKVVSCYTDRATQQKLRSIFEYAASLFDEVMIDDFWFTDCQCSSCDAARAARMVTIGGEHYAVPGDTWDEYRAELLVQLSRHYLLEAARHVNPRVKLIIKYPQWYDHFHERGYEVVRESADFDRIWVGTETRDYADPKWGGTVQYEAFFIMRWLGGLGGTKCGGGWFDPYGTSPATYLEQARQTVLGGARESMLFCYGSLCQDTGPSNVDALRAAIPELFTVAQEVARRRPAGIAAYKPPGSHAGNEGRVFDFVGMLGLPLIPCHEFPTNAPAAFFSIHAFKDPLFPGLLRDFIKQGRPVLLTDGLANALADRNDLTRPGVQVLKVNAEPKTLLKLAQVAIDTLRAPLLKPWGIDFHAPNQTALYLFTDGSRVVENFNDEPVEIRINGQPERIPARGWVALWK